MAVVSELLKRDLQTLLREARQSSTLPLLSVRMDWALKSAIGYAPLLSAQRRWYSPLCSRTHSAVCACVCLGSESSSFMATGRLVR